MRMNNSLVVLKRMVYKKRVKVIEWGVVIIGT